MGLVLQSKQYLPHRCLRKTSSDYRIADIRGGTEDYDPEGIAIAPDHTLWIASEGNASDSRPNRLLQVDLTGNVIKEVDLPQEILDCRAASTRRGTLGSGFEGVAVLPDNSSGYKLLVAQQRDWDYTTSACEDLDDDAGGLNARIEPNPHLDLRSGSWYLGAYRLGTGTAASQCLLGRPVQGHLRAGGFVCRARTR
jgi:hypothetical protein